MSLACFNNRSVKRQRDRRRAASTFAEGVGRIQSEGMVFAGLALITTTLLLAACGGFGGSSGGSAGTGSVRVTWTAPSERADGSPLAPNAIAGYVVYARTPMSAGDVSVHIPDGAATSEVIRDLPARTYLVSVSAVDVDGREGPPSNPIVVRVE